MPIDKRNISISFGQGIDTKTDPNQVMPGKLLSLENAFLTETMVLQKRYGYQLLTSNYQVSTTALTNQKLGIFNNELLTLDGASLYSYNPTSNTNNFIDNLTACEPQVSEINRDAGADINPDSAYNTTYGTYLYTWSSNTAASNSYDLTKSILGFKVLSSIGSQLFNGTISGISRIRAWSIQNNFCISGINIATSSLVTYSFPANATTATLNAINIGYVGATQFDLTNNTTRTSIFARYDGRVAGNTFNLVWYNPASTSITVGLINNNGTLASSAAVSGIDASGALGAFGDSNYIWAAAYDGILNAKYFQMSSTGLNTIVGPGVFATYPSSTQMSTVNPVYFPVQITGYAEGNVGNAFLQLTTTQSFPSFYQFAIAGNQGAPFPFTSRVRTDYIVNYSLNGGGSTSSIVVRGIGLASKPFKYNGNVYFLGAYDCLNHNTQPYLAGDKLQPTYFLINSSNQNKVAMKLAYENGGGYSFLSGAGNDLGLPIPNVSKVSQHSYLSSYLFKSAATEIGVTNFIPVTLGVNSLAMHFNSPNTFKNTSIGNSFNIAGGYLDMYDGANVVENNFHLFPQDIAIASTGGAIGVGLSPQTYSYQIQYEWQDNQGNIHRSSPSIGYSFTPSTAGSSHYLQIPTLRLTNKKNAYIRVFRNAPTIDVSTYHDVAPNFSNINTINIFGNGPIPNSTAIDSVIFVDNITDASLIANPTIYTTGGVLQDTGAPSPYNMSLYKNRLMMTDAENRNTVWYSKEVEQATPVEMTDFQTFFVSPRHGEVKAHIEMDDKFIIFTATDNDGAIYYMTGGGPDATGNNNDFSEPTLITTTVSTTNQNSVILMPLGIMFQSNKGIWLLPRSLAEPVYIGAPVEAFNANTVTSANLIPNSTRINFTLNNGICLVYDYFQQQWSTFTNINGNHAIVFQGLFTYLNSNGVFQETPANYSDNGSPILISLQTSWLSAAGLQGYQRVYKLYLMGHYLTPHLLNVSIAYDFNPSFVQTAQIRPIASQNQAYGSDPLWGSMNLFGGYSQFEQNRMNLKRQKCQSIQVTIQESIDPLNFVLGAGVQLENIGLVIGNKLTFPKIPGKLSVK